MKTVLITGANGGIGIATVKLFLQKNYKVIAHYNRNKTQLEELDSKNLTTIQADLSSDSEIEKLTTCLCFQYDIDILVNNAGIYCASPDLNEINSVQLLDAYKVNAVAPFLLTQNLIPKMMQNGWGRVINISSIGVKYGGSINSIAYAMSKSSLETMSLSFAKYAAKYGVLVNTIRVGVTNTDFHLQNKTKNIQQRIELIPEKRMASADEIAQKILFLASDESSFITGAILNVSGGE